MIEDKDNLSGSEIRKQIRFRFSIFSVLMIFLSLIVIFNVLYIQFDEGPYWLKKISDQTREDVVVPAVRGNIYAGDGQLMASTMPKYALYMDMKCDGMNVDSFRHYLPALSKKLAVHFKDRSARGYEHYLNYGLIKGSREYLVSKKKVTYSEYAEIKKFPFFCKGRNISGLYEKKFLYREKIFGSLASRTIGSIYSDVDKGGKNGLELEYDSLLKGIPGKCIRKKIAGMYRSVTVSEPINGLDIVSTLNIKYQDLVENALRKELEFDWAASGSAILMDVKTGQVLAISNLGGNHIDGYHEDMNRAVSDMSEPGSVFKIFSMCVGMEDGYIHPNDTVDTGPGRKLMYGRWMRDHNENHGGYHVIDAKKSIWYSSNIGVSTLIDKHYHNQPSKFRDGLMDLGFGSLKRVGIPGAGFPYIKNPKAVNKNGNSLWAKTDLAWMSIGYVTQIPPIYILAMYNGLANDGKLMNPYFVKEFRKGDEVVKRIEPEVLKERMCSKKTIKEIKLMMDSVVISGTGKTLKSDYIKISGKSATAQLGYGGGGRVYHQVEFCGYFPSDKPRFSAIVVIRKPGKGYPSGGSMCGRVMKDFAEKIYAQLERREVEPQKKYEYPYVRRGNSKYTNKILDLLNIDNHFDFASCDWIYPKTDSTGIHFTKEKINQNRMPEVRGMGAKDALFLLENLGLRVKLSGSGYVYRQSISHNQIFRKGDTVYLTLK